jgi:hypothetical protein
MRLIRWKHLKNWTRWKYHHELDPIEFLTWPMSSDEERASYHIIFFSHRWMSRSHPDPDGRQLEEAKKRVVEAGKISMKSWVGGQPFSEKDFELLFDKTSDSFLIFYDLSSIALPADGNDNSVFERDLRHIGLLLEQSSLYILSAGYEEYLDRGWCFFEASVAAKRIAIFQDQMEIYKEIAFLKHSYNREDHIAAFNERTGAQAGFLITKHMLNYFPRPLSAEPAIATLSHMDRCKFTHDRDRAIVLNLLCNAYFNRRDDLFVQLLAGAAQHFSLSMALLFEQQKPFDEWVLLECRPYFEKPDWKRLPSFTEQNLCIKNGMCSFAEVSDEKGLFSIPGSVYDDIFGEATAKPHGIILRLERDGVLDYTKFVNEIVNRENAESNHVKVDSMLRSQFSADRKTPFDRSPFESVDSVVVTIVKERIGLVVRQDWLGMMICRADNDPSVLY